MIKRLNYGEVTFNRCELEGKKNKGILFSHSRNVDIYHFLFCIN